MGYLWGIDVLFTRFGWYAEVCIYLFPVLMVQKILTRCLVLAGLLCVLNMLYGFFLYPKDLAELSKEIVQIRATQDFTDVYYFGESSNVTFRENDSLKNSVSEFASWFYPELRFTTVTKYATHSGIYK